MRVQLLHVHWAPTPGSYDHHAILLLSPTPLTQKPCVESKPTTTRAWFTPLLLQVEEEKMPPPYNCAEERVRRSASLGA